MGSGGDVSISRLAAGGMTTTTTQKLETHFPVLSDGNLHHQKGIR